ncbi:RNI-like protein [Nemania sp. FL0916]|nr:RNI-like protein [Nemania sp. FL0916]
MSSQRSGRGIRGPHSALTDYLASQNISAARIRADAEARRQAALANSPNNPATSGPVTRRSRRGTQQQNDGNGENEGGDEEEDQGEDEDKNEDGENGAGQPAPTTARQRRDQKRKQQMEAIAKIKAKKANKKRKRNADSESDEDLALALFNEKAAPLPGQMSNCEICTKRFTVTPYSRSGPNGGLVCSPCGRELAKDDEANRKSKKKKGPAPKGAVGRRAMQKRIMDGTYHVGAKTLTTLCIETLAKNIDLADDLGGLPPPVIDRIARLLSKNRLLDARTLDLFLQSHHEIINVYDAAKLLSDDFIKIFQLLPWLKRLKLRNAIQFTDKVMQYLISRNINLESLYMHGASLISDAMWAEYLEKKGVHLKELQVYYNDRSFGVETAAMTPTWCPNLTRLKICHNQLVDTDAVRRLAASPKLEHLSLQLTESISTEAYSFVIEQLGHQLQTFSIKNTLDVDDCLLDAIHDNCTQLSKLRITGSEFMTDEGFVRLFRHWKNKPLRFIDLQKCRHVDSDKPRENAQKVGLCSQGFEALMEHSGPDLRYLNVHACRHITRETFEKVFAGDKVYPQLRYVEISFCEEVDDFVVGSVFRSCPNLREANVFGCMKVKDVRVPKGKILVGVPNAVGMRIEGVDD